MLVPPGPPPQPCRTWTPPDRPARPHPTNRHHVRERTGPRSAHHRGRRRLWCSGRWTDKHLRRRAPLARWGCGIAWMRRHPGFVVSALPNRPKSVVARIPVCVQPIVADQHVRVGGRRKSQRGHAKRKACCESLNRCVSIPAHTLGLNIERGHDVQAHTGKSLQSTARFQVRSVTLGGQAVQSITAACLRSVIGRASSCSSQMRCSFSRVSSRPAPTLRPGVKVAGSLRMPWMTPMVS